MEQKARPAAVRDTEISWATSARAVACSRIAPVVVRTVVSSGSRWSCRLARGRGAVAWWRFHNKHPKQPSRSRGLTKRLPFSFSSVRNKNIQELSFPFPLAFPFHPILSNRPLPLKSSFPRSLFVGLLQRLALLCLSASFPLLRGPTARYTQFALHCCFIQSPIMWYVYPSGPAKSISLPFSPFPLPPMPPWIQTEIP